MPIILDGIAEDDVSDRIKIVGPTTIFVEGTFDGGTVEIFVCRTATSESEPVSIGTYTAQAVVNDTIIGTHYVIAELRNSGGSADCTVSTLPG